MSEGFWPLMSQPRLVPAMSTMRSTRPAQGAGAGEGSPSRGTVPALAYRNAFRAMSAPMLWPTSTMRR